MKSSNRRAFLGDSAKVGIGTLLVAPALSSLLESCKTTKQIIQPAGAPKTGFDQQPLPYAYNALEPWIDTETMDLHYNKHAAAYCKNLKEAAKAENVDTNQPLENVLSKISTYSVKMRNNGGGHYNHELFWKSISANTSTQPTGKLLTAINAQFGSLDNLKAQFNEAAKSRFGSGWAWLSITNDKKLVVSSTPNQDNPLMDIAETKGIPIIGLDVWEHAYYLKYRNRRAEYIDNFWKILNWNYVMDRYSKCI